MKLKRGELKSLVESVRSEYDNQWDADLRLEEDMTSLVKEGKVKSEDIDFNAWATELVTGGIPLAEYVQYPGIKALTEAMGASAFPILTKVVVGNTVIQSYESASGISSELVTEYNSKSTSEDTVPGFTATGSFEKREEGMRYEEKSFGEKKVQIQLSDFGMMFALTEEAIYEDKLGYLTGWAREAGQKGGHHKAKLIIQTIEVADRAAFNESSDTSRAHVSNGTRISKANHYLASTHAGVTGLDGQVNINTIAGDAGGKITTAQLQNLLLLFDGMTDEKGDEIVVVPTTILTSLKILPSAYQLMHSTGQYDTANRADNYFEGMFKVYSSTFLSQNYYLYLGDFKRQMAWLWMRKPSTQMHVSSATEAFTNRIIWRILFSYHGGCGHTNYVFIVRGGQA